MPPPGRRRHRPTGGGGHGAGGARGDGPPPRLSPRGARRHAPLTRRAGAHAAGGQARRLRRRLRAHLRPPQGPRHARQAPPAAQVRLLRGFLPGVGGDAPRAGSVDLGGEGSRRGHRRRGSRRDLSGQRRTAGERGRHRGRVPQLQRDVLVHRGARPGYDRL